MNPPFARRSRAALNCPAADGTPVASDPAKLVARRLVVRTKSGGGPRSAIGVEDRREGRCHVSVATDRSHQAPAEAGQVGGEGGVALAVDVEEEVEPGEGRGEFAGIG